MILYEYGLFKWRGKWALETKELEIIERPKTYSRTGKFDNFGFDCRRFLKHDEIEKLLIGYSNYYFYSFNRDKQGEFIQMVIDLQQKELQEFEAKLLRKKEDIQIVCELKNEESK